MTSPKIKSFTKNKDGNDYVVGDIHGCFTLLAEKLDKIGFEQDKDRLFSVGDLVDRGTESHKAMEWLNKPWFYSVLGNHEQMAIDCVNGFYHAGDYIKNGGDWFLELDVAQRLIFAEAFKKLPIAIEVETDLGLIGIIHAECPVADWSELETALTDHNAEAFEMTCLWSRNRIKRGVTSIIKNIDTVIVGHTILNTDQWFGNVHYIDTGAYSTGNLTIVKI
jgi:serine/threonine protein phosphatase 1